MNTTFFSTLFGIYVAATFVQLLLWWGCFARLAWLKSTPPPNKGAAKLPLSVIICARNEAANLRNNLPFVLEQSYPLFEVLVIDDDSEDNSSQVLQQLQQKHPHLRVLRLSPKTTPGKKRALAKGIAAAQHEHLVFTDADCRPKSPDWLVCMAQYFLPVDSKRKHGADHTQSNMPPDRPEIILGYGPYRPKPGFLNRWIRFETVQTAMQYFSFSLIGQPYMGVGRNLAWHRDLFRRVGGFKTHESIPSGDDDLFVNAAATSGNTAICLEPASFMYSEGECTWRSWWQQKKRHLTAGPKYRKWHKILLGAAALSHILHFFLLTILLPSEFGTISAALYALRMASAFPIYWKVISRLREEQLLIWFPLLDALLVFFYAALVPLGLIQSDNLISWK